jgi:membrane protease YdiL (CAAX protease family)
LALAVAIGLRFAPRLGLRSYTADAVATGAAVWPRLRADAPVAIAVGVAQMALVLTFELAFRPFMGDAWRRLEAGQDLLGSPATALIAGLFYGGITEELMVRWGLLSLVAWAAVRIARASADPPPRWALWTAILLAAVLFGAGHLPATSAIVPLTPVIVTRTIVLNTIAGVVFGWLFWRRSLEAAMIAHASSHVVLFVVKLTTR